MPIYTLNLSAVLHLLNLKGAICGYGEEFQTQIFIIHSIDEDLIIFFPYVDKIKSCPQR